MVSRENPLVTAITDPQSLLVGFLILRREHLGAQIEDGQWTRDGDSFAHFDDHEIPTQPHQYMF